MGGPVRVHGVNQKACEDWNRVCVGQVYLSLDQNHAKVVDSTFNALFSEVLTVSRKFIDQRIHNFPFYWVFCGN